jgi:hypothetical protein
LQPGGRRFDPGQLHQNFVCGGDALNHFIDRLFDLRASLVPIVAGVVAIVGMIHKHQERLAKIERGIDPDDRGPQQR